MNNLTHNKLFFLIASIMLSLGFYKNQWKAVEMADVQYRRDASEIYVMGRLVKSRADGVFSDGGLLGIGDVLSLGDRTNKTIKNQFFKYFNNKKFKQYQTYKSTPGFQGVIFSVFDKYTAFAPETNLLIFRWSVSISLAIILAFFCLWIAGEVGWIAATFVLLFMLASNWLTAMGGNLYWSLWAFYLPLIVLLYKLRFDRANNEFSSRSIFIFVFCLGLVKILVTGFEFITAGLFMFTIPFVYYAVLRRWGWKLFFNRVMALAYALFSAVIVGLTILGLQIKSVLGGYAESVEYINFALLRRTAGVQSDWVNPMSVVARYLNGYAFSFSRRLHIESNIMKNIVDGKYLLIVFLIMIASIVFFVKFKSLTDIEKFQKGLALVIATWYSMLAPLSWFLVFKSHANNHLSLAFIVWDMPFTFFSAALIGYIISVRKSR